MKWSDDDLKQSGELEVDSVYSFEIVEAEERVSQKGNPYINLKLRVFVDDSERTLYDIIMPQMPDKLRSFCETLGLIDQYQAHSLSADDCGAGSGFLRTQKKLDLNGRVRVDSYLSKRPGSFPDKQEVPSRKVNHKAILDQAGEEDAPF